MTRLSSNSHTPRTNWHDNALMNIDRMKRLFFLFVITTLTVLTSFTKPDVRKTTYHPCLKGDALTYHVSKADGTPVADYSVTTVESSEDDGEVSSMTEYRFFKPDGKSYFSGDNRFHMTFNQTADGTTTVGMDEIYKALKLQSLLPSGDAAHLPASMEVGDVLPDTVINAKTGPVNATLTTTNRKVLDHKTISCKAGKYECWLVHEECTTHTPVSKSTVISDTWYTPGIGSVRQTIYDNKGRVRIIEELTSCNYM